MPTFATRWWRPEIRGCDAQLAGLRQDGRGDEEDLKGRGRFQNLGVRQGVHGGGPEGPGPLPDLGVHRRGHTGNADLAELPPSQLEALFSVENARLMENAKFVELLNNPAFIEAARNGSLPDAQKVRGAEQFAAALSDLVRAYPDALNVLSTEAARNITRDAQFATVFDQAQPDARQRRGEGPGRQGRARDHGRCRVPAGREPDRVHGRADGVPDGDEVALRGEQIGLGGALQGGGVAASRAAGPTGRA